MCATCPDELEADFQQYYGIDLENAWENCSARRLGVLAAQLPEESRSLKSVIDEDWSAEMHMLANIEHELRTLIWLQANQFSKRKSQPPKRIKSPSERRKFEGRVTATDFEAIDAALGIKR